MMEYGTVEYFVNQINEEKEVTFQKTVFISFTRNIVNDSTRTAAQKITLLKNLTEAWEKVPKGTY